MNLLALGVIAFGIGVLVLMQVCDGLPGRAFYSRRAFEPPVMTWADQQRLERIYDQQWAGPDAGLLGPADHYELRRQQRRELERG